MPWWIGNLFASGWAGEEKEALQALAEFVVTPKLGNVAPKVRNQVAVTHHEILMAAESEKADLIVVSTHDRAELTKLLIGRVKGKILLSSSVDECRRCTARDRIYRRSNGQIFRRFSSKQECIPRRLLMWIGSVRLPRPDVSPYRLKRSVSDLQLRRWLPDFSVSRSHQLR
ncbi:MAG: universal stress protein [Hoeflea sp.]|uniref:universal stress protein n=1 Tax=Hoeflea sp. TaxID=1940281 RepID=UPI003EF0E1C9